MKCFLDEYNKKYLSIALPAALEGIFMTVLQAADLVMVGALGSTAIAAVSIFMPLRLVLLTFARSLASRFSLLENLVLVMKQASKHYYVNPLRLLF